MWLFLWHKRFCQVLLIILLKDTSNILLCLYLFQFTTLWMHLIRSTKTLKVHFSEDCKKNARENRFQHWENLGYHHYMKNILVRWVKISIKYRSIYTQWYSVRNTLYYGMFKTLKMHDNNYCEQKMFLNRHQFTQIWSHYVKKYAFTFFRFSHLING